MTLGDLFEEHYNYKKDKVKLNTLSNYGKKIKHFNLIRDINTFFKDIRYIAVSLSIPLSGSKA